jgi:Retrotransposon gag protein
MPSQHQFRARSSTMDRTSPGSHSLPPTGNTSSSPSAADPRLEELQSTVDALRAEMHVLARDRVTSLSEADVRPPEPFSGKSADLSLFLDLLRHVFSSRRAQFRHEKTKVDYAISHLRGKAFDWVRPHLRAEEPPEWMDTFEAFAREISERFEAPNDFEDAADRFCSLSQAGSVAAYAEELQECAAILRCPNAIAVRLFYRGLKASLKDELISVPKDMPLKDYAKTVIAIDNSLRERAKERAHEMRPAPPALKKNRTTQPQAAPLAPPARSAPLATRTPAPVSQGSSASHPTRPPLTEEEKNYRRLNHLCLYCGDPGHVVHDCTARPPRPPARTAGAILAATSLQGNAPVQLQ